MSGRIVDVNGCPLYVRVDGYASAPPLMLSNSLGTDLHLWDAQAAEWARHFHVVRYDRRGHGRSGLGHAPRTMETLGSDALAIMDALGLDTVNWCGLSMGGMVGQWLGANAPERIEKLVLSNTAAWFADKTRWNVRIETVRAQGIEAVADGVMNIWFTADFRAREPETVARFRQVLCETPVEGYLASCETLRDMDLRGALPKITAPTLIIAGKHDLSTPLAEAEYLRAHIAGAALTVLDAAHISNVELPALYAETVTKFLNAPAR
jgi:3-oxoadipate enol-lactonase